MQRILGNERNMHAIACFGGALMQACVALVCGTTLYAYYVMIGRARDITLATCVGSSVSAALLLAAGCIAFWCNEYFPSWCLRMITCFWEIVTVILNGLVLHDVQPLNVCAVVVICANGVSVIVQLCWCGLIYSARLEHERQGLLRPHAQAQPHPV